MDIVTALGQEQAKLQNQLKGFEAAIAALNRSHHSTACTQVGSQKGITPKRTMSSAVRAKISKATKARWAKYRAEKAKSLGS
jgi:hypothetical protein